MKKYQTMTISGLPECLRRFEEALVSNLNDWKHNTELTEKGRLGSDCLALDVPARVNSRDATLFLMTLKDASAYSVSNVVPAGGRLSEDEYNAILRAFFEDCIKPLAEPYNLTIDFSKEEVFVEETLSAENMSRLQEFARMANKSTGASHPYDYERWISFISASVKDSQIIEPALLQTWLIEHGFPDYIAYELISQYQFGIDLIRHIEMGEVGATR